MDAPNIDLIYPKDLLILKISRVWQKSFARQAQINFEI